MKKATEKKIYSLTNYNLIDTMIKDIAAVERTTESAIAEEILLGVRPGLLPQNKDAATLINRFYLEENAVSQMYRSIMLDAAAQDYLSGAPQTESVIIQKLHSVLCFYVMGPNDTTLDGDLKWYVKQADYYLSYLEDELKKIEDADPTATYNLRSEIRFGRDLWKELCEEPQFSKYFNFLSIVIKTWEYSGRCTYTYRMIAAMLQIAEIPNTPANRVDMVATLREAYK